MKFSLFMPLVLLCILFHSNVAHAFQLADANPPFSRTGSKYIFYWSKFQCELSEENGYKGKMEIPANEFRQILTNSPKLWDGISINYQLTFKLEKMPVSGSEYLTQLEKLDTYITPKIKAGYTITLSDLQLGQGLTGTIDIMLSDGEQEVRNSQADYFSRYDHPYLNDVWIEPASWGREDIYNNSNRDYFSIREFWQNIRQEPVLVWKDFIKPKPLRCIIGIVSEDNTNISLADRLDDVLYQDLIALLEPYKHLIRPGTKIDLELQSADQYEKLYKKTMWLVSDNDPRLTLQRDRDLHQVDINWGAWHERFEGLYLRSFNTPDAGMLLADKPVKRNSAISYKEDEHQFPAESEPEIKIDDIRIPDHFTFRVTSPDSQQIWIDSHHYDVQEVDDFFNQPEKELDYFRIDSLVVDGYDFPQTGFTVRQIQLNNPLMVRNNLDALLRLSVMGSTVKIAEPVFEENDLSFSIEFPKESDAIFSIFGPNELALYLEKKHFTIGTNIIKVPRSSFGEKGTHFAFINTLMGVSRIKFEIP